MTEPMTPEELEDATRYVAFGESTFDKAFAEERNLPLLRRLLDENARLNAENARYLRIINEITRDNAGLTSCLDAVQAEAHKMLAEHGQSWNSISGRRILNVFDAAPEMPRPPAEEADAEYMVVIPSLCGNPTDYRMSYSSDRVRKSTREAAIAHGLEVEGHDDWLIAIVVGDKLTGLAWQHEDRDDAEEVEEAAAALGLTAAFTMPIPATQEPASGPETAGTGSGRGTGVAETPGTAQAGDAWREFSRVIDEEEPDDILAAALDIPGLWADENQPEAPAEAEHVTAVRSTYRPGYASVLLRLIADAETTTPYYRRPVIVQDGAITDAGFLRDAVAAVWGAVPHLLPSLPVPSTEEGQ